MPKIKVKGRIIFDRKRLKRIHVMKAKDKDIFILRIKTLDKVTLSTSVITTYWTKRTLEIIFDCLLRTGELKL